MSPEKLKEIQESMEYHLTEAARIMTREATIQSRVQPLLADLDEKTCIYFGNGSLVVDVYNREDLQKFMTLAPKWNKSSLNNGIRYFAWAEGNMGSVYLNAYDAALPPTCKVVEVEEVIPAQEARTVRRQMIKCDV